MRLLHLSVLLGLILTSCVKDTKRIVVVQGRSLDKVSRQPVPNIDILVEAVENGSGGIISFGGRTDYLGTIKTDANGYYKASFKVFPEADHLAFYANTASADSGYTDLKDDLYLSEMKLDGSDTLDFLLNPIALLRIFFKNTPPASETDSFSFSYGALGRWTGRVVSQSNCGSVAVANGPWWIGGQVCGDKVVQIEADRMALVYWQVRQGGKGMLYSDSVFVGRNATTNFSIEY